MSNFLSPAWHPSVVADTGWVLEKLKSYLPGQHYSVFKNGSCVIWPNSEPLGTEASVATIRAVVEHHPDFKVRRHPSGDFLVTFRGGVGGVMSGHILRDNIDLFRKEALSLGKLNSEEFRVDGPGLFDDLDLIAGLYVRALLYLDVKSPAIVASR